MILMSGRFGNQMSVTSQITFRKLNNAQGWKLSVKCRHFVDGT
jgi:hypothetical protein